MSQRIFNFAAGPATLPLSVLEKAQSELLNYQDSGMSVMEMSHRSKVFEGILNRTEADLRRIMGIPENYAVLFLQGGASLQFSMLPMNLYLKDKPVDVIHTGVWTAKAIEELQKVAPYTIVASGEAEGFRAIPKLTPDLFNPNASYVHMASNNTIYGTQSTQFPDTGAVPLVCDMSSDILSRRVEVEKFGVIFAGAQKNLGPSGLTLVIIRKDLAERASADLPAMLNYRTHIKNISLYNTPPTFGIYIMGLVLQWIDEQGGLAGIEARNEEKAALLYQAIEESPFYHCPNVIGHRSKMNVVFRVHGNQEDLEAQFVKEATQRGLNELKGHRSAGGLRASLYNAQSIEGVKALVEFMKDFEKRNRV